MRPLRACLFSSPGAEKLLHQRATFVFQHAGSYLDTMIQKLRIANTKATVHRACALVWRAVNQPPHACLDQRSRTHRTRLDRRVNIEARQPVITELSGGLTKSDDFSVGSWIAVGAGAVSGNGNQGVATDNTRADRHLTATSSLLSRGQRLPHPLLISFRGSIH